MGGPGLALAVATLAALASLTVASISIKPSQFDQLIMPCYLGGQGGTGMGGGVPSYGVPPSMGMQSMGGMGGQTIRGQSVGAQMGMGDPPPPSYLGSSVQSGMAPSPSGLQPQPLISPSNPLEVTNGQQRNLLGQSMPRPNTIENFIALVTKIEVANPRLANNPDALIRSLLSRFRLDNYYYDVRSRMPISDQDRRTTDILPALMEGPGAQAAGPYGATASSVSGGDILPDLLLDQDEKCSMYFMLSHFIDKTTPGSNPSLGQMPLNQRAGPLNGQRPPSLQAAGVGYPANSANLAYSGGGGGGGVGGPIAGGARYPGPSPSFGSPLTQGMTSFSTGITNSNPEMVNQRNPFGVNSPAQASSSSSLYGGQSPALSAAANQLRNPNAAYPAAPARPPYIDASVTARNLNAGGQSANAYAANIGGGLQQRDDRLAIEYGVVTTANQDNSALVLNRVLLGMLAATMPPQSIRQLATLIYPTQSLANTPRLDDEIDPLFAVTLADLWAVSSIPKPGKPLDFRLLGDNGRWNDAMCPTSFTLERSNSIRFTTAELLGGLDGFNLGMFRRRLISMRRNIRLSELLRIYYSKMGFRPQFPEIGVCNRGATLNTQLDELHRQAENYLRLYQLSLPTSDNEIAMQITRLDGFREITRQAANNYIPQDICLESTSSSLDLYPMNGQDQCEISRADVVAVLDSSQQANLPFMQLVVAKLAQRIGLSRGTNSFSIMTNQQDTSGYAGAYSFNSVVRNSTNLGEIGCALTMDTTSSYQGGQVTDPTRLMEMFERALVNLDSEYLTRQMTSGVTSYNRNNQQSSYVSTWFGGQGGGSGFGAGDQSYMYTPGGQGGPRNTGGAKVILWFNYGPQVRPSQVANGPTNWNPNAQSSSSIFGSPSLGEQQEYKFYEAKKYLRENFRGASILALSPSREDVKAFVYDEERDIITDVAGGNGGLGSDPYSSAAAAASSSSSSSSSGYPGQQQQVDPGTYAMLSGQADQLVGKLIQRMCTIPAIFQYPMCFRVPSENTASAGYISPGRKQYWMMSPKTFFASRSVRLVFKVMGGRLRVCFGRKPNPDETAARYNQQNGIYNSQPSITFQPSQQTYQQQQGGANGGSIQPMSTTPPPTPSSSDYYTGLEYGVCKDVSPGQEIDFLISDPCYHKSIAECEPFYFVIRETSQPGEGDPNYMCRDDGCKRFDQAKFVMTHTGVSCSSALKGVQASWFLIMISTIAASLFSLNFATSSTAMTSSGREGNELNGRWRRQTSCLVRGLSKCVSLGLITIYLAATQQVAQAQQQAGVYDFGQNRYGEKRGNFTPSEVLAIILIIMIILGGLALTIGLCYYITRRARSGLQPVAQDGY